MDIPVHDFAGNGLVSVPQGGPAAVVCATEGGEISVTAELWDGAPALHADEWEDAAEVSLNWPTTTMHIGGDEVTPLEETAALTLPSPGSYRLRVHGRHRDAGDVRNEGDPVEEYLIQLWPAPEDKPVLHKATSQLGAAHRIRHDDDPGQIHGVSYADIAAQYRALGEG
jgi:hypothetical protein